MAIMTRVAAVLATVLLVAAAVSAAEEPRWVDGLQCPASCKVLQLLVEW